MKKDIVVVCVIVFLLAVLISGTKIQSVEDYYLTHIDEITPDSQTVFLTIDCRTILDNRDMLDPALDDEKYVPSDGFILKRTEYVLRKGDTVFNILDRAIRHNKMHMECIYTQQYASIYVQGINQLYEFSCGPLSGWMYMVNGEFPSYGCSRYILSDKDEIVWCYTCDLGRDVGNDWNLDSESNGLISDNPLDSIVEKDSELLGALSISYAGALVTNIETFKSEVMPRLYTEKRRYI